MHINHWFPFFSLSYIESLNYETTLLILVQPTLAMVFLGKKRLQQVANLGNYAVKRLWVDNTNKENMPDTLVNFWQVI